ncbi:MAG: MotA/TolQ/ExbB proton channel family protein [Pseudobacteriovorax sp.]|nr:MotA/TolQ/ExbB proton channel family protein [Pseudobacteriovorax sp.]
MEFDIVEKLLAMTLLGSEWVLWLLLILSVVSIAIMIERAIFYTRIKIDFREFSEALTKKMIDREYDDAKSICEAFPAIESQVVLRGLEFREKGSEAVEQGMNSYLAGERQKLDHGLVVLGTLGNNAPFIGLFGTVIGIIQAFNDLANNPAGGPSVVMGGISEALVATAVGLLVAIPAVIAYNGYQRVVKRHLANAEAVKNIVVAQITK